ncbi:MAG: VWA domain-containing protein [Desulfovibrionaceae bacterium]
MNVVIAVLLPVLLGAAGLAVDLGQIYLAHSRLQNAVDAAALAGALELPYDPDVTEGVVQGAVASMLKRNFEEAELVSLAPGGEVRSVCVNAAVEVPTLLMGALGIASNTVEAHACAGFNHLEVVFVIDNSGSMKGTPMQQTAAACTDLVELILPDTSSPDTRVGLVPFRGKVRIPGAVDGLPAGCRNADGTLDEGLRDEYMPLYWALSYYTRRNVSLDTCPSIPETKALTGEKEAIIAAINEMDGYGDWSGTVISEGIKWGRHVLTPEAPFTEGKDEARIRKIMILLTDGDTEDGECGGGYDVGYSPNNYWTNAYYGMGDTETHCENGGGLNQAMLTEAQLAKDAGIEIFTIRFGSSDSVDIQLMKEIASSKPGTNDHYFDAPSAYDIGDIFKQIGRQLGWRLLN